MDTIIKYLKNPMKVGVYSYTTILDFSKLLKYFTDFIEELKNREKALKESPRKILLEHRIHELEEAVKKHNIEKAQDYFQSLTNVFYALYDHWKEDPEVRNVFVKSDKGSSKTHPAKDFFQSHILEDFSDVIVIDSKKIANEKWLFEFMTIKNESIFDFKKKLSLIPTLRESMKEKGEKRHFSTRYVYRPYPLAVQLLLEDKSTFPIPSDLKNFLNGAIRYFFIQEWRTSIVLSAITIESILADLYEEYTREPAPDTPLGDLLGKVNAKNPFPDDIIEKLETANNARIAAVHRSRLPVSDTDAVNALVGATNFIIWSHTQS